MRAPCALAGAVALALLAASALAFAGWAIVSETQPDPDIARGAEAKPVVYDRVDDGRMVVDESTGESWVEHPDGSRDYLTRGE